MVVPRKEIALLGKAIVLLGKYPAPYIC